MLVLYCYYRATAYMQSGLYASTCQFFCHTVGSVKTVEVRILQFSLYSSPSL